MPRPLAMLSALSLAALLVAAIPRPAPVPMPPPIPEASDAGQPAPTPSVSGVPAAFVPNRGQFADGVRLAAVTPHGLVAALRGGLLLGQSAADAGGWAVRVALGAAGEPEAEAPLEGLTHYLRGPDPDAWVRDVPRFGAVRYRQAWPGVDALVRLGPGRLEYDLLVEPGADAAAIELTYEGADALEVAEGGTLRVRTPLGEWVEGPLVAWQDGEAGREPVAVSFNLRGGGRVGYALGPYDLTRPLVIDPPLVYATYLGGSGRDEAHAVAADVAGSVYVAGHTSSLDFPTTPGAFDATHNNTDAFVAKLRPDGSGLVYATYLGGGGPDWASALAVAGAGSAYVAGWTYSGNFPTTPGAFDTTLSGAQDAFVAKLRLDGSGLVYATYLGGGGSDEGAHALAVDGVGSAYVVGHTTLLDFPTTPGAFDTTLSGWGDAFVAKLKADGSGLVYATYLGGGGPDDEAHAVAVDGVGSAYVAGHTSSLDFPTTPGAFDITHNGYEDAFVAKVVKPGPWAGFGLGTTPSGALQLSWNGEALPNLTGYTLFVVRGSPLHSEPLAVLSPEATDYTSAGPWAPGTGTMECYVLAAMSSLTPLGLSDLLCAFPNTGSATGAPPRFTLRLDGSGSASLTWAAPGGQSGYALVAIPLNGASWRTVGLLSDRTSATDETGGVPTCYALRALAGGTVLGTTDALCVVPGLATSATTAAGQPAPASPATRSTEGALAPARAAAERSVGAPSVREALERALREAAPTSPGGRAEPSPTPGR